MDNSDESKESIRSVKNGSIQRRKDRVRDTDKESIAASSRAHWLKQYSMAQRITDSLLSFIPTISKKSSVDQGSNTNNSTQVNQPHLSHEDVSVPSTSKELQKPHVASESALQKPLLPSCSHTFQNGPAPIENTLSLYSDKPPQSRRMVNNSGRFVHDDSVSEISDKSGVSVSTSGISSLQPHADIQLDDLASRSRMDSLMGSRRFKRAALAGYSQSLYSIPVASEKRSMSFTSDSQSKRLKLHSNLSYTSSQGEASYRQSLFYSGRTFYGGSSNTQWDFTRKQRPSVIQETVTPLQIEVEVESKKKDRTTVMSSTARKILCSLEKASSVYETGAGFGPSVTNPFNVTSSNSRSYHYTPYSSGYRKYRERLSARAAQQNQKTSVKKISNRLPINTNPAYFNSIVDNNNTVTSYSFKGKVRGDQGTSQFGVERLESSPAVKDSTSFPQLLSQDTKSNDTATSVKFTLGTLPIFKPQVNNISDHDVDLDYDATDFGFSRPVSRNPSFHQMLDQQCEVITSPNTSVEFKFSSPMSSESVKPSSDFPQCQKFEPVLKQKPALPATTESITISSGSVLDVLMRTPDHNASKSDMNRISSGSNTALLPSVDDKSSKQSDQKNITPELIKLKELASSSWNCESCFAQNDNSVTHCICCQACRLSSTKNDQSNSAQTESDTPQLTHIKELSMKRWTCDICLVENEQEKVSCVACQNRKPSSSLPPKVACGTERSISSRSINSTKDSTPQLIQIQADSKSKWSCDMCLLQNDASKTICAACESPKPNCASQENPKTISGFQLPSSVFQIKSDFRLGSSDSAEPALGFKFGSSDTAEPASGFKFGSSDTAEPASGFKFGSSNTTEPASGFKFGSSDTAEPASGFKFGSSGLSGPTSGSKFGSNTESHLGIKFGLPDSSEHKSGFQFGSSNENSKSNLGSSDSTVSCSSNVNHTESNFKCNSDIFVTKRSESSINDNAANNCFSFSQNSRPSTFGASLKSNSNFSVSTVALPSPATSVSSISSSQKSFKFSSGFGNNSPNIFGANATHQENVGHESGLSIKFNNETKTSFPSMANSSELSNNVSTTMQNSAITKSFSNPMFKVSNSFAKPTIEQSKPSFVFGQPPMNYLSQENPESSKPSIIASGSKPETKNCNLFSYNKSFGCDTASSDAEGTAMSKSSLFNLPLSSTQTNSNTLFTVNGLSKSESTPSFQFSNSVPSATSGSLFKFSSQTSADSNSNVLKPQLSESTTTFQFGKSPSENQLWNSFSSKDENIPSTNNNISNVQSSSSNQPSRPRAKGFRRIQR